MKNRVSFIVDGFNLYHSVKQAESALKSSTKWLNIRALCSSYLHLFGKNAVLTSIYYFSALALHLEAKNPDVTKRHKTFLRCLKDQGIFVELNRFKKKEIKCPNCGCQIKKHEEKETDVAISIKLIEIFLKDECDTAILVSGDTDIAPAVKTAREVFPNKKVCFAFPYQRKNRELQTLCPNSFTIKGPKYVSHQFDNPCILSDGTHISKPPSW